MGQAKNKGSFKQRQTAAYNRIGINQAAASEHIEKLTEMEVEAVGRTNAAAAQLITSHWKCSGINRRMLRSTCQMAFTSALDGKIIGRG